jgi:tRNA(Phe) wybutosine-synthesizing methylase Tyw3
VRVKASVDYGIANLVERLNTIKGVETHASCQGWIDGHASYRPYVMVSFDRQDALNILQRHYYLSEIHETWCMVHPLVSDQRDRRCS